mgnify:FL=1
MRNSFHPHCHLHIATTNKTSKEQIESVLKPLWIDIVSRNATKEDMIPNMERGCQIEVGRDDPWYLERKSLKDRQTEEFLRESQRNSYQKMMERFNSSFTQEEMESTLVQFHSSAAEGESTEKPSLIQRMISVLKTFYWNCINRYRVHLRVNKKHPIYPQLQKI